MTLEFDTYVFVGCNCLRWWPTMGHHWPGCPGFVEERDGPDCDHHMGFDVQPVVCRKCGYPLWIVEEPAEEI